MTDRKVEYSERDDKGLITRRRFMGWTVLGGALGSLFIVAYPLLRFLEPRAGAASNTGKTAVEISDPPPPGESVKFRFGRYPAILVNYEGHYYAYGAICTHLGCIVHYEQAGCSMPHPRSQIHCVCHGGHFDVKTAEVIAGPPPSPLPKLNLQEREGKVIITGWENEGYMRSLTTYA